MWWMKKPEESQLICLRSDSEYRAQLRLKAGALVRQGSISKHKANTHRKDSGITVAQGEWLQARNSPAATPIHHLRGLSSPFFQGLAWEQQGSKGLLADKRAGPRCGWRRQLLLGNLSGIGAVASLPVGATNPAVPWQEWWLRSWTNWLALEASWEKMICCRIPVSPVSIHSLVKPDL